MSSFPHTSSLGARLDEIVLGVWFGLMREQLLHGATASELSDESVSATITVTGPWLGAIAMSYSRATADRVTARLHGTTPADVTALDRSDTIGEVLNIVAGQLRASLPAGCVFGLPMTDADAMSGDLGDRELAVARLYRFGNDVIRFGVVGR